MKHRKEKPLEESEVNKKNQTARAFSRALFNTINNFEWMSSLAIVVIVDYIHIYIYPSRRTK